MKYLFYDESGNVDLIYYVEPPAELGDNYVIYNDDVPQKEGFHTVTKVNLKTEEVYFEFEEIPTSEDDKKVRELEQKIQAQESAIAELTVLLSMIMGGVS